MLRIRLFGLSNRQLPRTLCEIKIDNMENIIYNNKGEYMNCYCKENKEKFIYCVEDVEEKYFPNIEHAWFKRENGKFIKEYPNNIENKDIIKNNFKKYGESMFKSEGNWKYSLKIFVERCKSENIKWYIFGSASEAIIGVDIVPFDLDIIIHVDHFYKVEKIFLDYLIEPFVDNKKTWVVQFFGRICIEGVMIDIVADEKLNEDNNEYENILWENLEIKSYPLLKRYNIEKEGKNRKERIIKMEEYMNKNGIKYI